MTLLPLFLLLLLDGEGADPSVQVAVEPTEVASGGAVRIAITNGRSEAVSLPGCNHYLFERERDGTFDVVHQKACFWEGYMVEVPPGETATFDDTLDGFEPGRYRVQVEYHLGCLAGEPLSRAGCQGSDTVHSPVFTVTAGPPR